MRRIAAVVALVLLASCGGGGGDSGGGGGSSAIAYTGNASPAAIGTTNAATLLATLVGSASASSSLGLGGDGVDGVAEVGHRLARGVRATLTRPVGANRGKNFGLAIPVDVTEPCDSGNVRVTGTLTDGGTGTLSIAYNSCRTGDDTLSGSGSMRVDAIIDLGGDVLLGDFTITFTFLSLRGPAINVDLSGSQRSHLDLATRTETLTLSIVKRDNAAGRMSRTENLVFVDVYNDVFNPTSYAETITGRIYDSVHGYVDVNTTVQLVFGTLMQEMPNGGVVELTGANGIRMRATAASTSLVVLALDLDNNGIFEIAASLGWDDLAGPLGADLADTDGDGMHNSWETARGLNPSDPADAVLDPDGDGAGNLSEYLAGTNPGSNTSVPPMAGLSIHASDTPDPATVGNSVTYVLNVINSGPGAGTNVVVTDTLPSGVNLISATASQGACAGSAPIICNLGTMEGALLATVTIVVSPTAQGTYVNTATLTSSSIDPDTSNNTAVSTTTVGLAAEGIQGQIDAAASGATIDVAPGTYFGNLDFGGKNITLQSAEGPGMTTLHGNNGTAVRIGPNGTIRGFTITGARAFFGAGVQVFGSGSVITGNVFDGNVAEIGGFGAAIGGNVSSPTIERNVFRNNVCDNQHIAGVVSFVNSSAPQIINNVFENNPCRAINISVIGPNDAAVVVNNTFVNNRTAVTGLRTGVPVIHVYRNNIIVQNGIGLDLQDGTPVAPPVWENNLLFGNTTDYLGTASQTGINGNIGGVDPLFANQAGGDYRLMTLSPAINAGSATGAPAIDFDGTARPQGAGFDIGAFERMP